MITGDEVARQMEAYANGVEPGLARVKYLVMELCSHLGHFCSMNAAVGDPVSARIFEEHAYGMCLLANAELLLRELSTPHLDTSTADACSTLTGAIRHAKNQIGDITARVYAMYLLSALLCSELGHQVSVWDAIMKQMPFAWEGEMPSSKLIVDWLGKY